MPGSVFGGRFTSRRVKRLAAETQSSGSQFFRLAVILTLGSRRIGLRLNPQRSSTRASALLIFKACVHVGAACVLQLFDFVGVLLKFKRTMISVLLAFMPVSLCVTLFAFVLEPRPTQAGDLPVVSELVSAFVSALP